MSSVYPNTVLREDPRSGASNRFVEPPRVLSRDQVEHYEREGYLVVRGVFGREEAHAMAAYYMDLRAQGPRAWDQGGAEDDPDDPWNRYPRMIGMHELDSRTRDWAWDPRLIDVVKDLIGEFPIMFNTMLYFKPPGARGQAFHQDHQYDTYDPMLGTWIALDRTDLANGTLSVFPRTHDLPLIPHRSVSTVESVTDVGMEIPEGYQEVPLELEAGDALFFHGRLIHGARPNTTTDRFRRTLHVHFAARVHKAWLPDSAPHNTSVDHSVEEKAAAFPALD